MAVSYVKYGTIWVAATISLAAGLWYARPNKSMVAGIDAAHVMAMADERRQVGYLLGTNEPNSYVLHNAYTNYTLTTNYSTVVTIYTKDDQGYSASPKTFTFTESDWSNEQYVTFSTAPGASSSRWFYLKRDGANHAGVAFNVAKSSGTPNGVYGGTASEGTLITEGNSVVAHEGTSQDAWIKLSAPPDTNPQVTTNSVYTDGVSDDGRVDRVMRWDNIANHTLYKVRNMVAYDTYAHGDVEGGGTYTPVGIYWTPEEFADGDAIASCEAGWKLAGTSFSTNTLQTVTGYYRTSTNFISYFHTTSTRWPKPEKTNYPLWAAWYDLANACLTNRPIEDEIYGGDFWLWGIDWEGNTSKSGVLPDFFDGFNNWWPLCGMGTNAPVLGFEIVTNNAVVAVSKVVTTNNLNEARGIMTNMTRTVAFMDFYDGALFVTSCVCKTRTAAHTVYPASGGSPDQYEMVGILGGMETVATTNVAWYYHPLLTVEYWGGYHACRDATNAVADQASAQYYINQYRFDGCTLPYPSDYACASGYVARVRIFMVGGAGWRPEVYGPNYYGRYHGVPYHFLTNLSYSSFYSLTPQPGSYDSYCMNGRVSHPSPHAGKDGVGGLFGWTGSAYDDIVGAGYMDQPATNILCLVADVTNPTTRPTFTLGSLDDVDIPTEGIGYEYARYSEPGDETKDEEYTWYSFIHSVAVYRFVVVVDWNWKFN